MNVRNAAKALIVKEGHILAIEKQGDQGSYYLLVGGGQHHGETLQETLKRECMEEAGVEVEPGDILFVRDYIAKHHEFSRMNPQFHQVEYMFTCRLLSGPNMSKATEHDQDQIGIAWLPLDRLEEYLLYPLTMRQMLKNYFLENKKQKVYLGDIN